MSAQQASFQERIARIESGTGFTKATVYVGQENAFTYVPGNRRQNDLGHFFSNAGYALSFPMAIAAGFLSHGLERLATFQVAGMPDPNASVDVEMVRAGVAGFLLAVVLTHLIGLRDRGLFIPKLLGVFCGMLFFHNLVHAWPQIFEQVFSPIWVARVTSMTEAHSLYWRGISFAF